VLVSVWVGIGILGVLAYEGPVADFMQEMRQRHLAAQFLQTGKVRPGEAVALLQIGRIHLNAVVVEGDTAAELRSGPGHRSGTALPGQPGEALIVGLRSRYGGPFARLGELAPGDSIVVQDRNGSGKPLGFEVTETSRAEASAIGPPAGDAVTLALVTSAPGRFSPGRILVRARLVAFTPLRGAPSVPAPPAGRPRSGYYAGVSPRIEDLAAPLVWVGVAVGAVLARRRVLAAYRSTVATAVLLPVAVFAVLELLLSLDGLIPGAR
jgi:sortase (surface protein transpeptidase)